MQNYSVLESWFNRTMVLYWEAGDAVEGKLMGADDVGLEFEVVRLINVTREGSQLDDPVEGDPTFVFVPWRNVKMLLRR